MCCLLTTQPKKSYLLSAFLFIFLKSIESYNAFFKKLFSLFNFFAQIIFLVDSSIQFICTRYFYPFAEYPFSFRGISWWSRIFSFQWQYPFLPIFGASYLANNSGTYLIVFTFVDNTFITLRLCLLPASRTHFRLSPKFLVKVEM